MKIDRFCLVTAGVVIGMLPDSARAQTGGEWDAAASYVQPTGSTRRVRGAGYGASVGVAFAATAPVRLRLAVSFARLGGRELRNQPVPQTSSALLEVTAAAVARIGSGRAGVAPYLDLGAGVGRLTHEDVAGSSNALFLLSGAGLRWGGAPFGFQVGVEHHLHATDYASGIDFSPTSILSARVGMSRRW